MKAERVLKSSPERLYESVHTNFYTFRNDIMKFDPDFLTKGIDEIAEKVKEFCDQETQNVVFSYILGARIVDINEAYGFSEDKIKEILRAAASSVALGAYDTSRFEANVSSQTSA